MTKQEDPRSQIPARDLSYDQAQTMIAAAVANGIVSGGLRLMLLASLVGILLGAFLMIIR